MSHCGTNDGGGMAQETRGNSESQDEKNPHIVRNKDLQFCRSLIIVVKTYTWWYRKEEMGSVIAVGNIRSLSYHVNQLRIPTCQVLIWLTIWALKVHHPVFLIIWLLYDLRMIIFAGIGVNHVPSSRNMRRIAAIWWIFRQHRRMNFLKPWVFGKFWAWV